MKRLPLFLALAVCVVFSGCAAYIDSKVTAFHVLDSTPARSFFIAPYPTQEASVEWRTYADQVARRLEAHGWKRVAESDGPQLAVYLSYGVKTVERTETAVLVGQTGYSSARTMGSVAGQGSNATFNATTRMTPTYGPVGSTQYSVTSHVRGLEVLAVDYRLWIRERRISPIYESRVESEGSTKEINVVMPYLLNALFSEFPGKSGETRRVRQDFSRQ